MIVLLKRFVVAGLLGLTLSGCQGGGASSLPVQQTQPAAESTPAAGSPQSVTVSIAIPAASAAAAASSRRPLYVSQNTQSAAIAVNGGTPVVANLAAGSANCTAAAGTGRTCTVAVSAPPGKDTFSEALYANTSATGTPLSENTTSATIVAGRANVVSIALDGVVASITLSLSNAAPTIGSPVTIPLTVNFNDASGAAIVGNDAFVNPITLTDSDTSGATKLSTTTIDNPSAASAITVAYTGAAIASAVFGASATGVAATSVASATLVPTAVPASTPTPVPTPTPVSTPIAFNDWPSYAYDAQRSGFNPNTTAITPAAIANLHLAWQTPVASSSQSQPVIVTGVAGHAALLVVAAFSTEQAYDALTGKRVWSTALPDQNVQGCGIGGVSGTAAYDAALGAIFVAAGKGSGAPNHVVVYRLNAATGTITGSVDVTPTLLSGEANYSHSGVAFANGRIYVGTGSDCEGSPKQTYVNWRGRVVAVDPASMSLLNTYFTTWQVGANPGNFGGGGVWEWGGVSADPSGNVYVAAGNAETNASTGALHATPPFATTNDEQAGLAEHLIKLSGDLASYEGSNYPGFNFAIGVSDLDYSGTPVIFAPAGCGVLSATQGKGGTLVVNNTQTLAEVASFALSIPSARQYYSGNPAYSPITGLLYAPITSAGTGSSMLPPGLAAIGDCGTTIVWHAQFGQDAAAFSGDTPRTAPVVTAGGVVFLGTPCTSNGAGGCGTPGTPAGALWAVDAKTSAVLNGGRPLLVTGDALRMAPSVDGKWLFVFDQSGNLYGLTVDPSVPAAAAQLGRRVTSLLHLDTQ